MCGLSKCKTLPQLLHYFHFFSEQKANVPARSFLWVCVRGKRAAARAPPRKPGSPHRVARHLRGSPSEALVTPCRIGVNSGRCISIGGCPLVFSVCTAMLVGRLCFWTPKDDTRSRKLQRNPFSEHSEYFRTSLSQFVFQQFRITDEPCFLLRTAAEGSWFFQYFLTTPYRVRNLPNPTQLSKTLHVLARPPAPGHTHTAKLAMSV